MEWIAKKIKHSFQWLLVIIGTIILVLWNKF